ncbi:MAG: hypothetical protein J5787_09130 [Alphaproteobacteria bacterium]|nr:hypothetical protein [Alphaproteobacteria bacterium]
MMKLIKIIDEQTKKCEVALNENPDEKTLAYYTAQGFAEGEWELGYDGVPYVKGHAPVPPVPTMEEQKAKRAAAYAMDVDPITAHIQRLRDEAEPDEEKIAALISERAEKVAAIREKYPYPEN